MANARQPACNHTDKTDIAQDFTEYAHIALDTQWECELTDNKTAYLFPWHPMHGNSSN